MRFPLILAVLFLTGFYSCNNSDKKETDTVAKTVDTAAAHVTRPFLKTDYPDRVFKFKKMADSAMEDQVVKYEKFSELFIEYVEIYKNQHLYSPQDQEDNTEAYNVLRDEMVSLKEKLRRNMALFSKNQEGRLDSADARMNKFLPQVYK